MNSPAKTPSDRPCIRCRCVRPFIARSSPLRPWRSLSLNAELRIHTVDVRGNADAAAVFAQALAVSAFSSSLTLWFTCAHEEWCAGTRLACKSLKALTAYFSSVADHMCVKAARPVARKRRFLKFCGFRLTVCSGGRVQVLHQRAQGDSRAGCGRAVSHFNRIRESRCAV